ncbi:alpha-ketoglutarate-dependent dioxygenase AlkB [Cyanobium sp. BA20m-p-22]|uniref:alpha-ketoglutarate-dependent dioxygenase AlkB n=1 Tax=Cyanobium sp. BA20m-p-22 TaxID=2823704 RepID=UPI0020CF12C4|nr:alpha-ketoglutarate-dependent dioxygenase AlkB [Cyanobium sp. BA20m-p-22]
MGIERGTGPRDGADPRERRWRQRLRPPFSIPLRDGDLLLMEPPAQMRLQQQALLNLTFRVGRSA